MDHTSFQHWMTNIEKLDSVQYQQAKAAFSGEFEELEVASLAAIEATIDDDRKCRHCGAPRAISRGKARGLRRYQCKTCNRTFNAATGTVLQGIHKKEKLLAYASCISEGCTIKDSAARCGMSIPTAFYWRHRFLDQQTHKKQNFAGIVEVDETFFLESRKGNRNLNRKARKRGGKASKRGLSSEQVPVLVIVDRSGTTASTVLPAVNAETLRNAIEPIVTSDILLVSDGNNAYPPCAAAMGVRHEALNLSKGKRVRGPIHIQTVNNRHSRLKRFLTRYNGVSTKYLQNYLRWFERIELVNAPPRLCLATAIEGNRIQFLN